MKIINTGITYKIYDDGVKIFDQLPVGTYQVGYSQNQGFFFEKMDNIVINEKIYGVHQSKVNKILDTFVDFDRNLGVILSGEKGIGKSICAKLLASGGIEKGYPVILVNEYISGIADFLASLKQEVICIFDEFEKTFNNKQNNSQTEMLTLFDGMYNGKKLFVVTCNELHNLNEFLVNRPGRFHYHLRFGYPASEEIKEYLIDKVPGITEKTINHIVNFAARVNLNYDCLRAITFELNRGEAFEEAIKDLNIVTVDNNVNRYTILAEFANGQRLKYKNAYVDFYTDEDGEPYEIGFSCPTSKTTRERCDYYVEFDPDDAIFDPIEQSNVILAEKLFDHSWRIDYDHVDPKDERVPIKSPLVRLIFKREGAKDIHYNL